MLYNTQIMWIAATSVEHGRSVRFDSGKTALLAELDWLEEYVIYKPGALVIIAQRVQEINKILKS